MLAEDAAAGRRSLRIHSSLAGIGASDDAVRLYLYESADPDAIVVDRFKRFAHAGRPHRRLPTGTDYTAASPPGGVSVSLGYHHRAAGTSTCLVADAAGDRYLPSNNHVIADTNAAPMGSRIVQPGTLDGGVTPRDDIALLAAFQRITFTGVNHIDAAIGALPDPGAVDPAILGIGAPANPPAPRPSASWYASTAEPRLSPQARSSTPPSTGSSTTDPPA